jgi:hypothetical protein
MSFQATLAGLIRSAAIREKVWAKALTYRAIGPMSRLPKRTTRNATMEKINAVAAELRASLPKGEFSEADIQHAARWLVANWPKAAR